MKKKMICNKAVGCKEVCVHRIPHEYNGYCYVPLADCRYGSCNCVKLPNESEKEL